jgi:acyl-coenzyme A synthetase/AMP-(fatty) acid ligase
VGLEQAVFGKSGLKIHNFYGSTECGGIAYDDSNKPREEAGLAGRTIANVTLGVEAEGCLAVRGANVAETYWPEADVTLGGGRFQTRDLAELWNGRVFLRGRIGDSINVAGRKVSPDTIEQALLQHPVVRNCLAFGVPSGEADRFEQIVAVVEVKSPATTAELRDFLLNRLPPWQVPRAWWFVDSLTANQRGKISRPEWRQRFLQERKSLGPA